MQTLFFQLLSHENKAVALSEAIGAVREGREATPVVEDLCEWLRSDRRIQPTYIERATAIEQELNLPDG